LSFLFLSSIASTGLEKTKIFHGVEEATNIILQLIRRAKNKIDICNDNTLPYVAIDVDSSYMDAVRDTISRGVKIRYIIEINKENIHYCKELMKIVSELRHLGGVKGNFVISETEYLSATTTVLKESQPVLQVIYSSAKGIVEAQQYTFDIFWSRALSAEYRIREIEEGVKYAGTKIKSKAVCGVRSLHVKGFNGISY
jgi:phosphatidylserine/phosphatidylglycerophosphate/cardiolipin synthase-like enzyme